MVTDKLLQPFVWFLFYPAVFFSSRVGGLRGGLVTTIFSTMLAWYFFVPTRFSFAVENPVIFVSLGMFVGMGVLFSLTHEKLRQMNRRVAESLATSDLKLRAALASMSDAVFISDAEGRFIEFNEAFATFHMRNSGSSPSSAWMKSIKLPMSAAISRAS